MPVFPLVDPAKYTVPTRIGEPTAAERDLICSQLVEIERLVPRDPAFEAPEKPLKADLLIERESSF